MRPERLAEELAAEKGARVNDATSASDALRSQKRQHSEEEERLQAELAAEKATAKRHERTTLAAHNKTEALGKMLSEWKVLVKEFGLGHNHFEALAGQVSIFNDFLKKSY